jgi:hypothetical protein
MEDIFKSFVGRLIKVTIKDGEEISSKRGRLLQVSNGFLLLETYNHKYAIRLDTVLKIKTIEGGKDHEKEKAR